MNIYEIGGISLVGIFIIVAVVLLCIAACVALALIPANIAKKKGYSFAGFYAFGLFLFVPALIVALCLPNKNANSDQP